MATDDFTVDKRIIDRNLQSGKISRADYEALLDALPDLSDKVYRPEDEEAAGRPETKYGDG